MDGFFLEAKRDFRTGIISKSIFTSSADEQPWVGIVLN